MSDTDNVSRAITNDPSLKHLQIASNGINVAIETSGGVDPDPIITVAESDECITLSPDFQQQSQNNDQNNNLHFYINAPGGTVQIGNCCIFLRINFDESLIHKLQDEGDIHVKLASSDVILNATWSNWDAKKDRIKAKIKVDFVTELKDDERIISGILRGLIYRNKNYVILRKVFEMLFERFHALVYKITGGCIEIWIATETVQQLHDIQSNKMRIEEILSGILISDNTISTFEKKRIRLKVNVCSETAEVRHQSAELPTITRGISSDSESEISSSEYPLTSDMMKELIDKQIEKNKESQRELFSRLGYMSKVSSSSSERSEQASSSASESRSSFFSARQLAYIDKQEFITRITRLINTTVETAREMQIELKAGVKLEDFTEHTIQDARTEILETIDSLLSTYPFDIDIEAFEENMLPEFESMFEGLMAVTGKIKDFASAERFSADTEWDHSLKSKMVTWKCRLALENYLFSKLTLSKEERRYLHSSFKQE